MDWSDLAFFGCALLAIMSAMVLIHQRQPVYAALSMLALFLGLTGIFTLLSASFVAAMQIMVYGGAVIVVFLFVIMLLNYQPDELPQEKETGFKLFIAIACGLAVLGLGTLVGLGSIRESAQQSATLADIQRITRQPVDAAIAPDAQGFLPLPAITLQGQIAGTAQNETAQAKIVAELKAVIGDKPTQQQAEKLQAEQTKLTKLRSEAAVLQKSAENQLSFGSTRGIGRSLFDQHQNDTHTRYSTSYMVPFELLSLLIVAAMLGAVILAKPKLMREPVGQAEPLAGSADAQAAAHREV